MLETLNWVSQFCKKNMIYVFLTLNASTVHWSVQFAVWQPVMIVASVYFRSDVEVLSMREVKEVTTVNAGASHLDSDLTADIMISTHWRWCSSPGVVCNEQLQRPWCCRRGLVSAVHSVEVCHAICTIRNIILPFSVTFLTCIELAEHTGRPKHKATLLYGSQL